MASRGAWGTPPSIFPFFLYLVFDIYPCNFVQVFKTKGDSDGLSQQQIVDCSVLTGNLGCGGGSFKNTLRYVELAGLMKESDYPYNGRQNLCKYSPLKEHVRIRNWKVSLLLMYQNAPNVHIFNKLKCKNTFHWFYV